MATYSYVIIGAGMSAAAAVQGIRDHDQAGEILIVGQEVFPPYKRPPLSKGLWREERIEDLWMSNDVQDSHLHLHLGDPVDEIQPDEHRIRTLGGLSWGYEKLLLATGGHARRLAGPPDRAFYPGTLSEHIRLWAQLRDKARKILVVGGGFIGSEMAAALTEKGHQVTWVISEEEPFAQWWPAILRDRVAQTYRDHGVDIRSGIRVEGIEHTKDGVAARTSNDLRLSADLAVVGIGWVPNDDLARSAGLCDEGPGIPVDEFGQTSQPNIFACGDVAYAPNAEHGRMHEDHALSQGRCVGATMAGTQVAYTDLPFFYSDLFSWGYEAVGDISTRHQIVEDWVNPGEEGVLYYLDGTRLVGVLNWNVWEGVGMARSLLERREAVTPEALRGKIRNPGSSA